MSERYETLDIPLDRTVIYVGEGAGKTDIGVHSIATSAWGQFQYHVLRLWEFDAQEFLEQNTLELLALIGQTHLEQAEQEVRQAVEQP